jgi:hypothetical protein
VRIRHNPVGVDDEFDSSTQGSSCLATLGFGTESRWDSGVLPRVREKDGGALGEPNSSFFIHPFFRARVVVFHALEEK